MNLDASESPWLMALTTAPSVEAASVMVRALVDRRLIACGTIIQGGISIYRWKGAVEESAEAVVLMKTTRARWQELKSVLPTLHPYDVPELLALPVTDGHGPYLEWLSAQT